MHAPLTSPTADLERAAVARLLSIGFTCPDGSTAGELGALADALASPGGGGPMNALREALADDAAVADLPFAYEELFGGAVRCPPYEGSYEADPFRGMRQMADASGFYRAFGAEAGGAAAERPDHVACELEFLSFLIARGIAAREGGREDEAARCEDAADDFIAGHLARFMGVLCDAVVTESRSPIYAALATVGTDWVSREVSARGITVAPVRRPAPSAVETDEVACGGAGGCPLIDPDGALRGAGDEGGAVP